MMTGLARLSVAFFMLVSLVTSSMAVDVTVYNGDLGLVRETRKIQLKSGINDVSVSDVASGIDATSVHFKSLTDPNGTEVIEQNFQFDLLSQEKLLDKYIDREIELETFRGLAAEKKEIHKGILLSTSGGRIVKIGKQIVMNPSGTIILPELPEGLLTRPTLKWQLSARKSAVHDAELSYLTSGLSWSADYVLVASMDDKNADLNAWVTLSNSSGAQYKDARLKLVAGDINRVQPRYKTEEKTFKRFQAADMMAEAPQFSEKSFFEYHMYTLQRRTTLMNNETKQIEMASASQIPLRKLFVYDGAKNIYFGDWGEFANTDQNYGTTGDKKVDVMLEFKNIKDNNLGIPLPKGRIRVYKADSDGALEFIGEDSIDHTPKDEKITVKMGQAFDVVGERRRTDFKIDSNRRWFEETFEIKLRNHKNEDISVEVVEHLYRWNNWKILQASQKWEKKNAQTIVFNLPIKKDGESVVSYSVKYSW